MRMINACSGFLNGNERLDKNKHSAVLALNTISQYFIACPITYTYARLHIPPVIFKITLCKALGL